MDVSKEAIEAGKHAADEAMNTVARICQPLRGESIPATMTAFAFTLYRIKVITAQMEKVLPGFADLMAGLADSIEREERPKFDQFADAERKCRGL